MSLLLLFRPHAAEGGGPDPTPEEGQTPAGRKRPQRKYVVQIDGREFTVNSVQEAINLLDRAERLAKQLAERQAEDTVELRLPKAIRLGKAAPVTPRVTVISGSLPIHKEIQATRERIERAYRDAALVAELRILMAIEAERDDEEAILLSL